MRKLHCSRLIGTAIWLAFSPPRSVPPLDLVEAIDALLSDRYRLREVIMKHEAGRRVLQIDLGGAIDEHPEFGTKLQTIAREHLGERVIVRLTYRHEDVLD